MKRNTLAGVAAALVIVIAPDSHGATVTSDVGGLFRVHQASCSVEPTYLDLCDSSSQIRGVLTVTTDFTVSDGHYVATGVSFTNSTPIGADYSPDFDLDQSIGSYWFDLDARGRVSSIVGLFEGSEQHGDFFGSTFEYTVGGSHDFGYLQASLIPEPATAALILTGLGLLTRRKPRSRA